MCIWDPIALLGFLIVVVLLHRQQKKHENRMDELRNEYHNE
jgi:hypothetical protein